MSSLWTPGGEFPAEPTPEGPGPGGGTTVDEAAAARIAEINAALRAAPADLIVVNHAMGLYQLAAVHLSAPEPDFRSAQLAIDALAALLDACEGRLGADEGTIRDARNQLMLVFAQLAVRHRDAD